MTTEEACAGLSRLVDLLRKSQQASDRIMIASGDGGLLASGGDLFMEARKISVALDEALAILVGEEGGDE